MATRTVTALFDSRAEAEQAVQSIVSEAGVNRSSVKVEAGSGATAGAAGTEDKGFFAPLRALLTPAAAPPAHDLAARCRGRRRAAAGPAGAGRRLSSAPLRDLFTPDEDRHAYAEGVRRGGAMVSAQVDDAQIATAMDVLERHGAVDLDEREASWKREGWTGYARAAAPGAGARAG